ncbi:MAG: aminoacyl-tRNA hydrolase [Anaerolineaceae bacterium]|nr:aminoacyl-tRNA hydrolase [Anaerolineaceae bacterium]
MRPELDLFSAIEKEVNFDYSQSSGPGGQNVNKVETAVQLRFDVINSPSLPEQVKRRLIRITGKRITSEGIFIITARRFRTREQNREDALLRLKSWIEKAASIPRKRKPTRPSKAAQARRLQSKKLHATKKGYRRKPGKEAWD